MTDIIEEIDRLVEEELSKGDNEVFVAVRRSDTGGLAFMGVFRTREDAIDICEKNCHRVLAWEAQGRAQRQWQSPQFTSSLAGVEHKFRYSISQEEIR